MPSIQSTEVSTTYKPKHKVNHHPITKIHVASAVLVSFVLELAGVNFVLELALCWLTYRLNTDLT